MLRLPDPTETAPPLVIEERPSKSPLPGGERVHGQHRRADEFDETFSSKEPLDPWFRRVVIAGALTIGASLLVGLFWMGTQDAGPRESAQAPGVKPETDSASRTEVAPVKAKAEIEDLDPAIRGVFDRSLAGNEEEWLLHPEETLPRMKEEPRGENRPADLKTILWNIPFSASGDRIGVAFQDEEFDTFCVWLVDEDGWKVDWESTVGWSEMSMAQIREAKPVEPVRVRVRLTKSNYYNFGFSDDGEWQCFRLEAPDGESYLYGYAEAASPIARTLNLIDERRNAVTLTIRFPQDPLTDQQVLIEKMISDTWVISDTEP